jgi:hypothetical protein
MSDPLLQSQIDRIRHEIEACGDSTVGCEQLSVLCPNATLHSTQFDAIARIAMTEHWSFVFLPDGSVCFARL